MRTRTRWALRVGFAAMVAGAAAAACGSSDDSNGTTGNGGDAGGGGSDATLAQDGQIVTGDGAVVDGCKTACPTGYTCQAFNGQSACASADGVPLFDHVFLVMMENISLKTLDDAVDSDADESGYFKTLASTYAKGSDYHGAHNDAGKAVHPSLPNYIAIASGDYQGVACDCNPLPEAGACNGASCNIANGSCGCNQSATNLADQIETASKTWKAYGEDMGTACNLASSGDYAVRHVPFLYFDSVRENATRCTSHVVDFTNLAGDLSGTTPNFVYIAPNLTDDGHDPNNPASHSTNIKNAAAFLAKMVPTITASDAYKDGGLLVVVWDEDDSSGIFSNDDPIPIYVASPYAKAGFTSSVTADHASLTATIEDGLNLPRLGRAKDAKALGDYFK